MHVSQEPWGTQAGSAASVVTIGMFDGVHCGHRALIRRALETAAATGFPAVALTFDRHADEVLQPDQAPPYLSTMREKVALIRALAVPRVIVARVTRRLLSTPAREFVVGMLRGYLEARVLVVGPDFRFGRGRQGDVALLKSMQGECGFTVEVLDRVYANGDPVSSTLIRGLLAGGEVERAAALLGRPYRLCGEVVRGEGVGRTLGFPTANLAYPHQKALPATGVYFCRAEVGGRRYAAAVSVGYRPTFGSNPLTVEAYLLDCSEDLYGKELCLDFLTRLRAEERFPSVEALRAQMHRDVEEVRRLYPDASLLLTDLK